MIVKLVIGRNDADPNDRSGAMVIERTGIKTFWELTEPKLLQHFEGRKFAYFEAETIDGQIEIGRRVPDQSW